MNFYYVLFNLCPVFFQKGLEAALEMSLGFLSTH